jgi:hypothetical protein
MLILTPGMKLLVSRFCFLQIILASFVGCRFLNTFFEDRLEDVFGKTCLFEMFLNILFFYFLMFRFLRDFYRLFFISRTLSGDLSEDNAFLLSGVDSGQFWSAGFLFCQLVKVDSAFFGGGNFRFNFSFVCKGIRLPNCFLISAPWSQKISPSCTSGTFFDLMFSVWK